MSMGEAEFYAAEQARRDPLDEIDELRERVAHLEEVLAFFVQHLTPGMHVMHADGETQMRAAAARIRSGNAWPPAAARRI